MDLLERMAVRLRDAVAAFADPAGRLTVGDVYQRLIPYRALRADLGLYELAEYEYALLRLLAGEGGHVRLDDTGARDELLRELASTNPILGIYRDYESVVVRLVETDLRPVEGIARREPDPESALPVAASTAVGPRNARAMSGAPRAVSDAAVAPAGTSSRPPSHLARMPANTAPEAHVPRTSGACTACDRPLPDLPELRFCPYCGHAREPQPCARCGTPLEGGWSFCIRCGTPRADAPLAD